MVIRVTKTKSGRKTAKLTDILVTFYQGPLAGMTIWVGRDILTTEHGRLCFHMADPRDLSGSCTYAQAKALPRGYGSPERWQTVDKDGNWVDDATRYGAGEYEPKDQTMPWTQYGAEGDPGGEVA